MATKFTQRDIDFAARFYKTVEIMPRTAFTIIGDMIVVGKLFAANDEFLAALQEYGSWTIEDNYVQVFTPKETEMFPLVLRFFLLNGYALIPLEFV